MISFLKMIWHWFFPAPVNPPDPEPDPLPIEVPANPPANANKDELRIYLALAIDKAERFQLAFRLVVDGTWSLNDLWANIGGDTRYFALFDYFKNVYFLWKNWTDPTPPDKPIDWSFLRGVMFRPDDIKKSNNWNFGKTLDEVLKHYSENGLNFIRFFIIHPWNLSFPYKKLDNGKYDLNQWDDQFFLDLHEWIKVSLHRGIADFISIFDACGLEVKKQERWFLNALNSKNNVNSRVVGASGTPEFYKSAYDDIHRALVNKVVGETKQYPNIVYEITNEGTDIPFENKICSMIRAAYPEAKILNSSLSKVPSNYFSPHNRTNPAQITAGTNSDGQKQIYAEDGSNAGDYNNRLAMTKKARQVGAHIEFYLHSQAAENDILKAFKNG